MVFIGIPTFRDSWFKRVKRRIFAESIFSVVDDNGEFVTINKFFLDPNSDDIKDYCYIIYDIKK